LVLSPEGVRENQHIGRNLKPRGLSPDVLAVLAAPDCHAVKFASPMPRRVRDRDAPDIIDALAGSPNGGARPGRAPERVGGFAMRPGPVVHRAAARTAPGGGLDRPRRAAVASPMPGFPAARACFSSHAWAKRFAAQSGGLNTAARLVCHRVPERVTERPSGVPRSV
jgi:hypothetical protein